MKPGEISSVFSDQSGYFIYKVGEKETASLDRVREQTGEELHVRRLEKEMRAIQEAAAPTLDDNYFGPAPR